MSTTDQWKKTLRWTAGITACFFVIYASAVAVQLLVNAARWAEGPSALPPEMLSNFLQMLVLGPFLFSIPVFVISLVVVRLVCAFMGKWKPPFANAGEDRTVQEAETVILIGSGSDPDGQIVSFAWEQLSGPTVTLSEPNTVQPSFVTPSVSANTTFRFRLTVTDICGFFLILGTATAVLPWL